MGFLIRSASFYMGSHTLSVFCACSWDARGAGAWEQGSGKDTMLQGSAWRWEAPGLARAKVQSQFSDTDERADKK